MAKDNNFDPEEFWGDVAKVTDSLKGEIKNNKKKIEKQGQKLSEIKNNSSVNVPDGGFVINGRFLGIDDKQMNKPAFWNDMAKVMAKHNVRKVTADLYKK